MNYLHRLLVVASAAFFIASSALAQNVGTVSNHAVAVGKGAGKQGLTSVAPSSTIGVPLVSQGSSADPSFADLTRLGTITTGVWNGTAIAAGFGGTGQSTFVIGDLLQASTTSTLSRLASVATGNVLISGGVGTASSWGKVGLTTHVSGVLGLANGGTASDLSATGGTSQFLRQNTAGGAITPVRPSCSDLSNATYCASTIGQLAGTTTNDNASSGNIGEYFAANLSSGSAISLTTTTAANVVSLSLGAGDWDISAFAAFVNAAATNTTQYIASLSTTSATLDTSTPFAFNIWNQPGSVSTATNQLNTGPLRVSLAGTTTYYLVVRSIFTVSTMTAYGSIRARRVR